jgi:alpha-beta hydrolase superfamily lysophospholipase
MPHLLRAAAVVALFLIPCCRTPGHRLVKPPRRALSTEAKDVLQQPHQHGICIRPFTVAASGGVSLAGLEITRAPGTLKPPRETLTFLDQLPTPMRSAAHRPRGTVLMLHGYQNRKEQWLPLATRLSWAGYRCILHDSRAHGESGGSYATFGHREAADCRAVLQAAGGASSPLFLLGYSMGGAIALKALDDLPAVQAVVTLATFDRFDRVAHDQLRPRLKALAPPAIAAMRVSTAIYTGHDLMHIRPADCLRRHQVPVLIVHGAEDTFIHPDAAIALERSAAGPVQRIMVPGKNHWSLFYDDQPALHAAIAAFLAAPRSSVSFKINHGP